MNIDEIPPESRAQLMRAIDGMPPIPAPLLEALAGIAAAAWGIGFADGKLAAIRELRDSLRTGEGP